MEGRESGREGEKGKGKEGVLDSFMSTWQQDSHLGRGISTEKMPPTDRPVVRPLD